MCFGAELIYSVVLGWNARTFLALVVCFARPLLLRDPCFGVGTTGSGVSDSGRG